LSSGFDCGIDESKNVALAATMSVSPFQSIMTAAHSTSVVAFGVRTMFASPLIDMLCTSGAAFPIVKLVVVFVLGEPTPAKTSCGANEKNAANSNTSRTTSVIPINGFLFFIFDYGFPVNFSSALFFEPAFFVHFFEIFFCGVPGNFCGL